MSEIADLLRELIRIMTDVRDEFAAVMDEVR
jgi:hypothetical protein